MFCHCRSARIDIKQYTVYYIQYTTFIKDTLTMNILIVDDEAPARRDLIKVLHRVVKDADVTEESDAAAALETCRKQDIDVLFLDIRMPQIDGLTLVQQVEKISPDTNIIIVTAYPEYSLEALRLFVSGYILKPAMEDEVRAALKHLRKPVREHKKVMPDGLYVQCFGNFEVFYDGTPLSFGRSQSKELFAYLIDRRGSSATNGECRAVLWEDAAIDSNRQRDYFHHIWADLKSTLTQLGCGDVLLQKRNSYAIDTNKVRCDYYEWIASGQPSDISHEYMRQYSWAEGRLFNKSL